MALNYEMLLKNLRKELHLKKIGTEQLESEVQTGRIENQTKESELIERKTQLESEILELERKNK